jgi:hypothetical protein
VTLFKECTFTESLSTVALSDKKPVPAGRSRNSCRGQKHKKKDNMNNTESKVDILELTNLKAVTINRPELFATPTFPNLLN